MALTDKLTAIANAIRAKTGGTATMTLAEMPTEIASIQTGITPSGSLPITENGTYDVTQYAEANVNVSGGAEITDGIVVKARDANGWATEIDVYASDGISKYFFSTNNKNSYGWWKLEKVNFKLPFTKVQETSFAYLANLKEITGLETLTGSVADNFRLHDTQIREISLPNYEPATQKWVICSKNTALKTAYFPKYTNFSYDGATTEFSFCTGLETVQIGSVGYPVSPTNYTFRGCTQTGLTVIAYSTSAKADSVLSSIRNGATNATIIIKDSTTGDVIVTSTP